jgi:beta-glucosidase
MLCGENRDRQGLRLPGRQEQYVEELLATGKPVVLVVFGGRAQVISGLAERCAAVVQAWYPGEEGGRAVADILYGHVSPSAKLSVSYPASELSHPICYNYPSALSDSLAAIESVNSKSVNSKSVNGKSVNGKSVNVRILWPFGHGLSYTTFAYSRLQVDSTVATDADAVSVVFDVENTGRVAADEVAQVYLSPSDAAQPLRPIQLQGFARVSLQPGERRTVSVRLHPEQFGYYSSDGSSQSGSSVARDGTGPSESESSTTRGGRRQWNILPGRYVVKVGASSADIRLEAAVVLTGRPVVKPLREHYFASVSIR